MLMYGRILHTASQYGIVVNFFRYKRTCYNVRTVCTDQSALCVSFYSSCSSDFSLTCLPASSFTSKRLSLPCPMKRKSRQQKKKTEIRQNSKRRYRKLSAPCGKIIP